MVLKSADPRGPADSADPAGVVQAVTAGVVRLVTGNLTPQERERTLDALADLYAEQTHVRHPLAPLGDQPMRSRAELRAHFAAAPSQEAGIRSFASTDMVVHRTADPEIVIAEFAYAVGTDRGAFTVPCIFVVRVHDGRIVESRDYADPLTFARALGQLPALADALTAENAPPTAETRS